MLSHSPDSAAHYRAALSVCEGVEASFDAEASEVGDDSPELSQPEIAVEKAQAFVPFSVELGADWSTLTQEVGMLFADAKEILEATKFILGEGSGSNEPEGLVSKIAEASLVETAAEKKVEAGDIYSLQQELGPRFQPNASWLSTLTVANQIYRFYSPAGEEPPLFNQDRTALLGKGWTEVSTMSSKTTTSEQKVLGLRRHRRRLHHRGPGGDERRDDSSPVR